MIPLNRASLVVKPSAPYVQWVRSRVGVRMSTQALIRLGGVYLVDFDAVGESLEEIVVDRRR